MPPSPSALTHEALDPARAAKTPEGRLSFLQHLEARLERDDQYREHLDAAPYAADPTRRPRPADLRLPSYERLLESYTESLTTIIEQNELVRTFYEYLKLEHQHGSPPPSDAPKMDDSGASSRPALDEDVPMTARSREVIAISHHDLHQRLRALEAFRDTLVQTTLIALDDRVSKLERFKKDGSGRGHLRVAALPCRQREAVGRG